MKNKILKILKYLPNIPKVFLEIKNPATFFLGYFKTTDNNINLFGDITLKTKNPDDISSISAIVVKNEYGKDFNKNNNWTIIDIGANKGFFSLYASKNPSNIIFSYEPITETYNELRDNIDLNKKNNVYTFNLGVAGKDGYRDFSYEDDKSILSSMIFDVGSESKSAKVQCITLKNLFTSNNLEKVDLLKMDCEGSEFEILYGTDNSILSRIKRIRMEYHNSPKEEAYNIDKLSLYLNKNGFRLTKKIQSNQTLGIAWFELV
ncbi:MAG: FkbM family methyltransferase [Candidatus Paceibacterota bacterium]